MERFVGKIAIVTGSSNGIGRAIVKELVKKGLIVVGLARNIKSQQDLEDEILANKAEYKGKFFPFKCDVSQEEEIRDTFAKIRSEVGDEIAVLINNAGVLQNKLDLMEVEIDEFDRVFLTNAKGLLLCAKEAIKCMSENNIAGHIINMNSIASIPDFNATTVQLYAASKYAARIFSHGLRRELTEKKSPIKISDISPGVVDTSMFHSFQGMYEKYQQVEIVLKSEDVAKACMQVIDTPVHVQISEMTIIPLNQP